MLHSINRAAVDSGMGGILLSGMTGTCNMTGNNEYETIFKHLDFGIGKFSGTTPGLMG